MLSVIQLESNHVSKDIPKTFEETYSLILKEISAILDNKPKKYLHEWVKSVVEYNVPHGKQIRGKLVEMSYKSLSGSTDPRKIEDAQILGWCVEILQASSLIADDLVDNGTTRRGRPCWHKINNMGIAAVNDAFLLENLVYQIIRRRFGSSKFYVNILDLFLNVTFNTILGQSLDISFSRHCLKDEEWLLSQSAKELNQSISTLKTGYYTIYLPIALAMILAGYESTRDSPEKDLWNRFEEIALKIGVFFQIQDDYFDCFADEKKMGKRGSDIQEGKCSWLYAKAMELSSKEQRNVIVENYRKAELSNVSRIKELYLELDIPNEFLAVKQKMSADILMSIGKLDDILLQNVLYKTFKQIFKGIS